MIGATNPLEATPGSIRGDYAIAVGQNMVHGSDCAGVGGARGRRCSSPSSPERHAVRAGLILASRSPQRRAILEQLGVAFAVVVPEVEELTAGPPQEVALENAYRKAARRRGRGIRRRSVLGVDTVVALGARIYGKPADREQARGDAAGARRPRRHAVISGVCLIDGRPRRGRAAATTAVELPGARRAAARAGTWRRGEWRERAGGYAIQGARRGARGRDRRATT